MDATEAPGHLARRFQQIAVAVFVADGGDRGLSATGASVAGPVGHAVIAAALGGG